RGSRFFPGPGATNDGNQSDGRIHPRRRRPGRWLPEWEIRLPGSSELENAFADRDRVAWFDSKVTAAVAASEAFRINLHNLVAAAAHGDALGRGNPGVAARHRDRLE